MITHIGLLGLGTVGTGVYKLLERVPDVTVSRIAVKDLNKARTIENLPPGILNEVPHAVAKDPEVDIVVELIGGLELPYQLIKEALEAGKHVVTANKMVIAQHGPELFKLAAKHKVNLLFEGAVAGGIPVIMPLKTTLAGNHILQIAGILNGTTNYILTRMEKEPGLTFAAALKGAQDKGFAEADPTADVDGHDAACKIAILASIAYSGHINLKQIHTEGITAIQPADIDMAKELGFGIKLIAMAKGDRGGNLDVRVHPMLVSLDHPLAKVQYENNAIWIKGDAVGDTMLYGKGAGELPTASSVTGDVLLIAHALQHQQSQIPGLSFSVQEERAIESIAATQNAYYVRLETEDKPGVIGFLGMACGDNNVSLDAILQRGTHPESQSATIVLLTHTVKESDMQKALEIMRQQPTTKKIHTVLRVFEP